MKVLYELMFVIRAYLPDNVRNEVYSFIDNTISSLEGEVVFKDIWGKRYMAYKIRSQKEGYYVVYQIKVDPSKVSKLRDKIRFKDEIIRFVVSKIDSKEIGVSFGKKVLSENN